jgi:CspA family cold shock protein
MAHLEFPGSTRRTALHDPRIHPRIPRHPDWPLAPEEQIFELFELSRAKLRAVVQKPDFSGEWILNVQESALSPVVAPVVESGFVRIEHREPVVSVHLQITMSGKPFDVRFERPSNWDGDVLVFVDTQPTPNGEMTIAFRYELLDSGRRLRAAEQLRGAGREQDNAWVFDNADALREHTPSPSEPLGTMRVALGTVKWWREAKGYGVIGVMELAPWDVWCHFSAIAGDGFRTLTEDETVEVEYYRADQESFKYVARSARRISRP